MLEHIYVRPMLGRFGVIHIEHLDVPRLEPFASDILMLWSILSGP